jgi:predicted glycosyltransferase
MKGIWSVKLEKASLEAPRLDDRTGAPRILAYCASNIGMGHFGELSRIAAEVRKALPDSSILLASDIRGSAAATIEGAAWLRLPGFRFDEGDDFKESPEFLSINAKALARLRSQVLLATAVSFQPRVVLMVTHPHGKRDEMLPALRHLRLRSPSSRIILLMRDIPVPPGEDFKLNGPLKKIRKHAALYDRILISGDRGFFDAAEAYGWPPDVCEKFDYTGFILPSQVHCSREEAFARFPELDASKKAIVCGFGGGWEVDEVAPRLIEGFARYRRDGAAAQLALFVGAASEKPGFDDLQRLARETGDVSLHGFDPHFPSLLPHCDMAILQSGFTPLHILESAVPMLLHFRDYTSAEQEARARRLARYPGVRLLERDELDGGDCAEWMAWGLDREHPARKTGLRFDGLESATREVLSAIEQTQES